MAAFRISPDALDAHRSGPFEAPGALPHQKAVQAADAAALAPAAASAEGRATPLGWALRPRALLLLILGAACLLPAFLLHLRAWVPFTFLATWDAAVLLLAMLELARLPRALSVTRRWLATPAQGQPTAYELALTHTGPVAVTAELNDELHPAVAAAPVEATLRVFPRDPTAAPLMAVPAARGDYALGSILCRLRGGLGLAERWITVPLQQTLRVYPSAVRAGSEGELPLLNARQLELEKRRLRHRGTGREFQSLREYQPGDAVRDLSWTASARRGRLITRQFTTERSQQVWVVLDCGRLSQTATVDTGGSVATQLDQAASAALLLARAVTATGDRFGLLAYGRTVRQQLLPGSGGGHLRLLVEQLAQAASERGEANHLRAVARFQQLQRRRSLVVWITEVAEGAGRPEIAAAVAELARRHLPLILLLEHPEVRALADAEALDADAMFQGAAAREMEERRRGLVAELERGGAMVVRTTAAGLASDAIRQYLEIKARGLL